MPRTTKPKDVERKLYTRREAAEALAMSLDTFERYVQPFVKTVMVGTLVQISPEELDRWIAEHSHIVRPEGV
jgi:excisionase family DNA binding protein